MTPDVVVDIGNSRVKWGRCRPTVRDGGWVALDHHDTAGWAAQAEAWGVGPGSRWAIGGVNPAGVGAVVEWVESIGGTVHVFHKPSELPISLAIDEPDAVGIDRVFGAIAARSMAPPDRPAITVDVGTAVTVNLVDAQGAFQGGAIFPGPRLMARALHDYTARLPLVDVTALDASLPAKNTTDAISRGIWHAVGGGVAELTSCLADVLTTKPHLFVTGGGAALVAGYGLPWAERLETVPALNLEGIRIAAEAQR